MLQRCFSVLVLLAAVIFALAASTGRDGEVYTAEFGIGASHALGPDGGNDYFSLRPGVFHRYEGEDDSIPVVVESTVLDQTRPVRFPADGQIVTVETRIVEEREWSDGALTQVSLSYFAACASTGNIYCFGCDVNHYEGAHVIGHDGSWLAGERGAGPGLMMPGFFLLGSRYQQEQAPHVAMDQAEHAGMGATVTTPAGTFRDCVIVLETTPLEPDEQSLKTYAPGVGLVLDDELQLVDFHD